MIVASAIGKNAQDFTDSLFITYQSFIEKEVDVIGIVANKVTREDLEIVTEKLHHKIPSSIQISIIPKIDFLNNPTVKEVTETLNGKILVIPTNEEIEIAKQTYLLLN